VVAYRPASPTQRAWLAGFLAGAASVANAPEPAAPARSAEPITILFASESGNCERLAADMAKAARKAGLKPSIVDMADLDLATLPACRRLVVIAATWGEGEPPARAAHAYAELMSEAAPRLDGIEFGVLALGDTAYAEFCAVGTAIDARLAALGGKRVVERIDCDLHFAGPAQRWIDGALKTLAPPDAMRGRVIEVRPLGSECCVVTGEQSIFLPWHPAGVGGCRAERRSARNYELPSSRCN
jgi:sulfite reductase (NADPH) flavoprotein alpha-component